MLAGACQFSRGYLSASQRRASGRPGRSRSEEFVTSAMTVSFGDCHIGIKVSDRHPRYALDESDAPDAAGNHHRNQHRQRAAILGELDIDMEFTRNCVARRLD